MKIKLRLNTRLQQGTLPGRKSSGGRGRRSKRRLAFEEKQAAAAKPKAALKPVPDAWLGRFPKVISGLLLAAMLVALYSLFTWDEFYVYGAEVRGNLVVTDEEVYAAGGVDRMSVFWIDPREVAGRVERLDYVQKARVTVRFPSALVIEVQERSPSLAWQSGESVWWVDDEGVIMTPRVHLEGVVTIIDSEARPVAPGERVDKSIIAAVYALRQVMPGLRVVQYTQAKGLIFATPEGWPVYIGDGSEIEAKIITLVALRDRLRAEGITPRFIDVRYPASPFYAGMGSDG